METKPLNGDTRCLVRMEGTNEPCGRPGEFHLIVEVTNDGVGVLAMTCAPCFEQIRSLANVEPFAHPVGSDCGMPGTYWSTEGCTIS
jgi:hypothetical protein